MSATSAAAMPRDTGGAGFELRAVSAGRYEARGSITFATARAVWEQGRKLLKADPSQAVEIDCAGITHADSAGLVVLLDWLADARRAGRTLSYHYLPESLLSLAAISDLHELLFNGVPA